LAFQRNPRLGSTGSEELNQQRQRIPGLQDPERRLDDLVLLLGMVRCPQRKTQWPIHQENSRGENLFRNLSEEGDGNGWNSRFFDYALDQSDRLIAERSDGG
jgi:hypothetical protein